MNQTKQMREALRALDFIKAAATPDSGIEYHQIRAIERALAAERAPLVRLTDEELNSIEGHAYIAWKGNMQLDVQKIFAHAIMDAMQEKNK